MRGAAAGLALLLLASPALAGRVAVRTGDHPGLGRIVLNLAAPNIPFELEEGPDGTLLRLPPDFPVDLPAARRPPRNLRGLEVRAEGLLLTLRPGARLRHYRLGNNLVLDVMDAVPSPRATPPNPRQPPAPVSAERAPQPAQPPGPPVAAALPVPSQPVPPPEPQPPPGALLRVLQVGDTRALSLPIPPETGLAILRRGDTILVVLDQPHTFNPAALRADPVFAGLRIDSFPEATILHLPLAAPAALRARRDGSRWLLIPVPEPERERSILAEPDGPRLILRASSPGRPVPVADPETGLPLLIGTLREPGQAMGAGRSLAQADLLPTQLGVAALARADSTALRRVGDRFLLSGIGGVTATPDPATEAAALSRLMELPRLDPGPAQERLRAQTASIAAAPPLARLPLRRAAAEGMLSLGLAQEAQAMMRLAFQEDSRASTDPRGLLVHAAAALLANRPAEAQGLLSPDLPASDELTLWRSVLAASTGDAAAAAPGFAATLPLALNYPEPVRTRLLPPAAEALLEHGDTAAARRLLRAAGDRPDLAYARARLAEAEDRTGEALALYAAVAEGRDRLARARAIRRATELRLAAGTFDAARAAQALEAALFAWRGDNEEFNNRLRIAELRQTAGDSRAALDLLRETGETFPDRTDGLRAAQEAALLQALARELPTISVALLETNEALLPRDARGAEALSLLAERLAAMDLPDRAASMAQRAQERATPAQRPTIASQLAALRLAAGDPRGALSALEAVPDPSASRTLLLARIRASLGETEAAIALLRNLGTPGLPALAELLASRQDWSGAAVAAAAQAATNPEDPAAPREILRAAAFATLARDTARLTALRKEWAERIGTGPLAEAFRILTTDPVQGLADLPRLQRELNLFRGIPAGLEAFRTAAAVSR